MKLTTAGYFWAIRPKTGRGDCVSNDFVAPLAYGESDMPFPDMLLRDRGASFFETKEQAVKAIKDTVRKAVADGSTWQKTYSIVLVSIKKHVGS